MALGMGRFLTEVLGSVSRFGSVSVKLRHYPRFASLASWSEPALIWEQNTLSLRDDAPHDRLVATVSETPVNLLAA